MKNKKQRNDEMHLGVNLFYKSNHNNDYCNVFLRNI